MILVQILTKILLLTSIHAGPHIETIKSCNDSLSVKMTNISFHNEQTKVIVSYSLMFTETLKGPVGITSEGQMCDFQKTRCIRAPGISYPNLCPIVAESIYGKFIFTKLDPPITKCPVKMGHYVLKRVSIDYAPWTNVIRFLQGRYEYENVIYDTINGKKRPVCCWILGFRLYPDRKHGRKP